MKKNMQKYGAIVILGSVLLFGSFVVHISTPTIVFAQANPGTNPPPVNPNPGQGTITPKIQNPINVSSLSDFVAVVLGIILKIAIPVVSAFIIWSGLMFVLARGNAEKLEKAKARFLYTLIGTGILLGAWMIATVIKATIDALTQ
jgi:hypothetical protein